LALLFEHLFHRLGFLDHHLRQNVGQNILDILNSRRPVQLEPLCLKKKKNRLGERQKEREIRERERESGKMEVVKVKMKILLIENFIFA